MEIVIDLKNPAKLRALQKELRDALKVVDFALQDIPEEFSLQVNGVAVSVPSRTVKAVYPAMTTAERIRKAIDTAGDKFTSADIYRQFNKAARTAIKSELKRRVTDKKLTMKQGEGRAPNTFERTT